MRSLYQVGATLSMGLPHAQRDAAAEANGGDDQAMPGQSTETADAAARSGPDTRK